MVIGSYPTQATPAFSQLAQLGSFWSHRFFLSRQRLHADTLRKLLLCPPPPAALPPPVPPAPPAASGRCSLVGEAAPADSDVGESRSGPGDDWRARLDGWVSGDGDGGAWTDAVMVIMGTRRVSRLRSQLRVVVARGARSARWVVVAAGSVALSKSQVDSIRGGGGVRSLSSSNKQPRRQPVGVVPIARRVLRMASPGRWCRRLSARDVRAVALRRRRDASGSGFYAKGQGAEYDAGGGCDTDKADVTASVQPLPKPARGSIVDVEKGNCKSARDDYSSVWSIAESLSWTWNHQNLFIASSTSMSITPSAQNRGADKELRWANHDSSIKAFHRVSPMKLPPPLQLGQSLSFPATSEPPGGGGVESPAHKFDHTEMPVRHNAIP